MRYANGTMNAGSQTKGKYATIVFGGSLKNCLIGPGVDKNATRKILATNSSPAKFYSTATMRGHLF